MTARSDLLRSPSKDEPANWLWAGVRPPILALWWALFGFSINEIGRLHDASEAGREAVRLVVTFAGASALVRIINTFVRISYWELRMCGARRVGWIRIELLAPFVVAAGVLVALSLTGFANPVRALAVSVGLVAYGTGAAWSRTRSADRVERLGELREHGNRVHKMLGDATDPLLAYQHLLAIRERVAPMERSRPRVRRRYR